ncbi:MAG TPA: hypothetical protein VJT50_06470 [Pyrinomonadaceae bacterium]|nr:hypothetical protein [Pyrinomonadaceae bacterium]
MLSQPGRRLTDDHVALDQILTRLCTALELADAKLIWATLDLFWARLAVHIRAEHLHLFPAVLQAASARANAAAPSLQETSSAIECLRKDHDFFMHELAPAVGIARELVNSPDQKHDAASLLKLRNTMLEVEQRLAIHNELEEAQIYSLVKKVLNEDEEADLAKRVEAELRHRPARFSQAEWSG